MTHGKAMQVLRELAENGFVVSICYGRCPCETHQNAIGWSVSLFADGGHVQVFEVQAARSFEHCVEIAKLEADSIVTRKPH